MKTIIYILCIYMISTGIVYAEEDPIIHGVLTCKYCHRVNESGSHFTHIYADKGPNMICTNCHSTDPGTSKFKDNKQFSDTTVCDICHSPGGTFNGISDSTIGAKPNWIGNVYDGSGNLRTGKEKWCVGCHDNEPSVIKGVKAPNVTGDGTTYGYYVTGHGNHSGFACTYCHNLSMTHIDGIERTYVPDGDFDLDSNSYQKGYRLKDVSTGHDGKYPLHIPRIGQSPPWSRADWEFALCFECHDSTKLFNGGNSDTGLGAETNFRKNISGDGGGSSVPVAGKWYSLHDVHTWGQNGPFGANVQYDSDFDGTVDSRMSCPSCHNVHGSKSPAMVRSGELEGKVPMLNLKYVNNAPGSSLTFISLDDLMGSTGAGFDISYGRGTITTTKVCEMCHAGQQGGPGPKRAYYRSPVDPKSGIKCAVCHP